MFFHIAALATMERRDSFPTGSGYPSAWLLFSFMKLYYHKTDGGAEYLMDTFIQWSHNGKSGKEGVINDRTKYIVRIDGDITKDADLTVRE